MKNRYWIMLLAGILVLCLVLALALSTPAPATHVRIKIGDHTDTVDLRQPQNFVFAADNGGYNIVTVEGGKIAVTESDCPDQHCVRRGFCGSGTPIICLPHGLVIEFLGQQEIDGMVG